MVEITKMIKMIKLNRCKKGVLFTIGFTFLALLILMLAILIFHSAQQSEDIVTRLSLLDRVYDLDNSIQQSLGDLFYIKSGISVNITNNSISFEERLPSTNAGIFNASMKSFKGFIESNFSFVNMTIDELVGQVPVEIVPYGITYKHVNFGGKQIMVVPQQINFKGYNVYMLISDNVSSCVWSTIDGSFDFTVDVVGQNGASCSGTRLISSSGENGVIVNSVVDISVDSGILSITIAEASLIDADVKTKVLVNSIEDLYLRYPLPVIKISFGELGVYKESMVRLD